jgi:hypothetical protein
MWKVHMMDPINYCHDCVLLCGRVVGNNPDGKLDAWAHEKRIHATRQLLRARYETKVDPDIWTFSSTHEAREDTDVELEEQSRAHAHEERSLPVFEVRSSPFDNRMRLDDMSAADDSVGGKYSGSDYAVSYRSGVSNKSGRIVPSKKKEMAGLQSVEDAEVLKTEAKSKPADFQIRIRTLKGQVHHLTVDQETTIYKIKSMIEEEHGTPKEQQHILFYGKVLEDWKTLAAHSIPPNAGLQLLTRSKRNVDPALEDRTESVTA